MNKDWVLIGTTALSGFLLATGCSLLNAPSEVKPGDNTGGLGGGSSASTASSSSGIGGIGGIGGMGGSGGNMMACEPGTQKSCYDGTPGTEGIGECLMGVATCAPNGSGYGPCAGQVVNADIDDCATPLFDEDCDGVENNQCPGEQLAIVTAAPLGYADDVKNYLLATTKFALIDVYDASAINPTLADLQAYQSVLVFSDKVFYEPKALGNTLADYYDGGGRVVLALFSTVGGGTQIQGRFGDPSQGYMITDSFGPLSPTIDDALGKILESQSRLMRNVSMFSYTSSTKLQGGPINGGTVVAEWGSGLPLVVRGTVLGRNRVDVNFYPPQVQMGTTRWMGDGATILSNALLF